MIPLDKVKLSELGKHLKNIPDNFIILIVSPKDRYESTNIEILKLLCNEEKSSGLYITFDKPYDLVSKTLHDAGVDTGKLFFIDLVTKTKKGSYERTKNCLFIPSPKEISDLGIAIDESIRASKNKKEFLFVDSVSALCLYNSAGTAKKFHHFLTIRMRIGNLQGILMSLPGETEKEIISFLAQFCDKTISVQQKLY